MKKEDNNKLERLLKMHEQAEQLSDEDIQKVLDDADDAADLNTLSDIKRAMATKRTDISDDEIDRQWETFEAKHSMLWQRESRRMGWSWMKIAAMFVGVMMIVGVAFAAIKVIVGHRQEASLKAEKTLTANKQSPVSTVNTVALSDSIDSAATDSANIVRFDDVELQTILNAVAQHHGLKLQYENEQSKHIRMFFKWNKQADIASIVQMLNSYDRISIELDGNVLIIK